MKQFLFILLLVCSIYYKPSVGIDISHHNNIDWNIINKSNIEFCYIKLTEGKQFIDNKAYLHSVNAKQCNIKIGYYHYFRTNVSGKKQLELFKNQLCKYNYDLVPVIDVENTGNDFSNKKQVKKELNDFIEGFKDEFGYYPIIYYGNLSAYRFLSVTSKCKSWFRTVGFDIPIFNFRQAKIENYSFGEIDINYCKNISRILIK